MITELVSALYDSGLSLLAETISLSRKQWDIDKRARVVQSLWAWYFMKDFHIVNQKCNWNVGLKVVSQTGENFDYKYRCLINEAVDQVTFLYKHKNYKAFSDMTVTMIEYLCPTNIYVCTELEIYTKCLDKDHNHHGYLLPWSWWPCSIRMVTYCGWSKKSNHDGLPEEQYTTSRS